MLKRLLKFLKTQVVRHKIYYFDDGGNRVWGPL
jgi:hypothetical protein